MPRRPKPEPSYFDRPNDDHVATMATVLSLQRCYYWSLNDVALYVAEHPTTIVDILETPYIRALRLFVYCDASIEEPKCDLPALIADLREQGLTYKQIGRILDCPPRSVRLLQRGEPVGANTLHNADWRLVERRIYHSPTRHRYRVRINGRKVQCDTLEQAREIRSEG